MRARPSPDPPALSRDVLQTVLRNDYLPPAPAPGRSDSNPDAPGASGSEPAPEVSEVKMNPFRRFALSGLAAAALAASVPAMGQDSSLGRHRDWYAAAFVEDGTQVCYMVSGPTRSEGDYTRRGKTYIQVTRRGGGGGGDVVSIEAGYPHREGGEVELRIDDGEPWTLFTRGETAWAYSDADDKALVAAMAAGTRMVVKGTSARGTDTVDAYSLLGFTAARRAISEACGP